MLPLHCPCLLLVPFPMIYILLLFFGVGSAFAADGDGAWFNGACQSNMSDCQSYGNAVYEGSRYWRCKSSNTSNCSSGGFRIEFWDDASGSDPTPCNETTEQWNAQDQVCEPLPPPSCQAPRVNRQYDESGQFLCLCPEGQSYNGSTCEDVSCPPGQIYEDATGQCKADSNASSCNAADFADAQQLASSYGTRVRVDTYTLPPEGTEIYTGNTVTFDCHGSCVMGSQSVYTLLETGQTQYKIQTEGSLQAYDLACPENLPTNTSDMNNIFLPGKAGGTEPDTDGDGIPDSRDSDIDGDGIGNAEDPDADGDGVDDKKDTDGDGTPDFNDGDIDGDGTPNGSDPDADGDGIPNEDDPTPNGGGSGGDAAKGDDIENESDKGKGQATNCDSPPSSEGDAQLAAIHMQLWVNACETGVVNGAGDCSTAPTCEGDAVTCAIHKIEWEEACAQREALSNATDEAVEHFTSQGMDDLGQVTEGQWFNQLNVGGEIDLQTQFGDFLQPAGETATCPQAQSVDLGQFGTISIGYNWFCDLADMIRPIILLIASVTGGVIVLRSAVGS